MPGPRLHQGLAARAEQQLLLQPRMLQSIEVLQVPAQDLDAWLQRAAEENEALLVERDLSDPGEPGPRPSGEAAGRHDAWLQAQPGREGGLEEALDAQLALLELSAERRGWLDLLVACLDPDGLLTAADEEREGPLAVTVHPDAAAGIGDGEVGLLESRIGALEVVVRHDPDHRRDTVRVPRARSVRLGRNVNQLVRARLTDYGEGCAFYDEGVRLRPLATT